jgi:S1-C subfamily serine protease
MPADDDEASGPPPHPLDRLWFHPSELGTGPVGTLRPEPASPKVWLVALLALLVGVSGTLGAVMAVNGLTGTSERSAVTRAVSQPLVDPDPVATLVTSVGRSIVTVTITPAEGGDAAPAGSGVVLRTGWVLTAAHLLAAGGVPAIVTAGGQIGTVKVLGIDPETDLALLVVDGADLVPARLGTGDNLRIGKTVAALAAGAGPDRWVSAGVISGLDQLGTLAGGVQGAALIETDVQFDDTAAGGALLDQTGAVVGILTGPDRHAVPIDVAREVAAQLDATGRVVHGWTGVLGTDALDRPGGGIRIRAVVAGSPAEAAGLVADDIVLAVGDVDVANVGELVAAIRTLKPGDPVEITVIRAGKRIEVPVALGESVPTPSDWLTVA